MKQHIDSKTHSTGTETLKRQKAKREAAAQKEKAVPQPRVTALRQPNLSHVLNFHYERFEVQDDVVFTMLACGIPVEKLNRKVFRAFLWKYTTIDGCLADEFPKHNCVRLQDGHHRIMRQKLKGEPGALMFDEWADERGVAVLGVVAHSKKLKFCIDVRFLEGKVPTMGWSIPRLQVHRLLHWPQFPFIQIKYDFA